MTFQPVDPKPDFAAQERERLRWWQDERILEAYLHRNDASQRRWSFIDGPITANNPMAVHHAWGRTYKDVFQRFRTMQGYRQRYQNGFDCQGLWIEVEVERELGFTSKLDIEAYGVGRFVEACKARVDKFAAQITEQSVRLAQWMDWDNSYFTNSDENNYAIWHFLKTCHERGWLYKGIDSMPWCPRCATGLSNMEIATEGYQEITHPSVYLKLPLNERPGESLLVWTTTPWTLAANVAAAVHADLTYARVRQGEDVLYLSKATLGVLKGEHTVEGELKGRELVGLTYRAPFDELPAQEGVRHPVIEWEGVSEDEGTGIVHIAPGCGQDDFALGKQFDLAVVAPIDQFGNYVEGFGFLEGRFAGDVAQDVFASLEQKGLLVRVQDYKHRYPVCWRCGSELVFRVVDEWFINMDGLDKKTGKSLREEMMDVTRKVRWIPDFGLERELDWLRNMADWMISKKRYYGLALPIYPCECGHVEVIGGKDELRERAVEGWDAFAQTGARPGEGHSPHRPWVDSVKIRCPQCGDTVSRITDVGNPWLDAGIVPFSTLQYDSDRSYWEQWFPADFIVESFPGQFRNWFYALLAMSTALENREPFRTTLGHALVRDEHGEEMHKSKGNAIWFDEAADRMGVDVMRWLFMRHNPATNVNFGWGRGDELRRTFFLTLWNTYAFFVTYANIDGWSPPANGSSRSTENELDRWVLSELHQLIADVTASLDSYETMTPTRRIESFVEDLSNWYVRRSRRRFWKSGDDDDKRSAYETLHECLLTLAKLMSPFAPYIADELYQNLVRSSDETAPTSVHLCDWPQADASLIDRTLAYEMDFIKAVASHGLGARKKAGVKVRQPLPRLILAGYDRHDRETALRFADILREELNVREIACEDRPDIFGHLEQSLNVHAIRRRFGRETPRVQQAFAKEDVRKGLELLGDPPPDREEGGITAITLDGIEFRPGDVKQEFVSSPGYSVSVHRTVWGGGPVKHHIVVVDTELTPELRDEGLAREMVHRIQKLRRDAGFDISDRIATSWQGDADVRRVLAAHGAYVASETLSTSLEESAPPTDAHASDQDVDGHKMTLGVRRAATPSPPAPLPRAGEG